MKNEKRISDIVLEQYVLGELNSATRKTIDDLLQTSPELRKRVDDIESSNREILSLYPADRTVGQIISKAAERNRSILTDIFNGKVAAGSGDGRHSALAVLVKGKGLAASIALSLVILFTVFGTGLVGESGADKSTGINNFTEESIRLKGDSAIVVHRLENSTPVRLSNGITARQGDLLQISYRAASADYGVIVSVDGRGSVTLHYPERPGLSTKLDKKSLVTLSRSYQLDDAPRFERFFFVTSKKALDVKRVIDATKSMDDAEHDKLVLSEDADQNSFLLLKK